MGSIDNIKKDCPGCGSKMKRVPNGEILVDDGVVYDEMVWICPNCDNEETAGADVHNYRV